MTLTATAVDTFLNATRQDIMRMQSAVRAAGKLRGVERRIKKLPAYGDTSGLSVSENYEGGAVIKVWLDRPDSPLVRELVREFHAPARKAPSWDGQSLVATLTVSGTAVEVYGYKPATCTVLYEDVLVPAHVMKKARVVCNPPIEEMGEVA